MNVIFASNSKKNTNLITNLLSSSPDYAIISFISDIKKIEGECKKHCPDMLLLDISISDETGKYVQQLMDNYPCTILLVTSEVSGNESKIFEAMRWGAIDVAVIPNSINNTEAGKEFIRKLNVMSKLVEIKPFKKLKHKTGQVPLTVIGSSTGGPKALSTILSGLNDDFDGCLLIVQHIDAEFTDGLLNWLKTFSKLDVQIAASGDQIAKGKVLIARGPKDLIISQSQNLQYVAPKQNLVFHPSIDILFESCVNNFNGAGMSILLSGMGHDGVDGMSKMKDAGWETIAQDEASCVIYGMPKAAVKQGAAKYVLPVNRIADAINEYTQSKK